MNLRTPLAAVRGHGSAKEGVDHWWMQRLTALANVPLLLWFVMSVVSLAGAEHADVVAWMSNPLVSALLVLTLVNLFYHLNLGLQVVIEDYVHPHSVKLVALIGVRFGAFLLGAISVISVLRVSFGG